MNNIIYIPASSKDKSKSCQVNKVGKLHKGKRIIKIADIRENLEVNAMRIAKIEGAKELRATNQRDERRAKRKS